MSIGELLDPELWNRHSRSHAFEFYALDFEVKDWLSTRLPDEFRPYSLVGDEPTELVPPNWKGIVGQARFEFEISQFPSVRHDTGRRRSMVAIWSHKLTPRLLDFADWDFPRTCNVNGLISLFHGGVMKPGGLIKRSGEWIEASLLSVVGCVSNQQTGELREHVGYLKIYNALLRAIKRKMAYHVLYLHGEGKESESLGAVMTEAAAEAVRRNEIDFNVKIGRRKE